MPKIKNFPKEIAVATDNGSDDEDYLVAEVEGASAFAAIGEKRKVGIYVLKEVVEVTALPDYQAAADTSTT